MKKLIFLAVLAISTSAMATEFKAHIEDVDCSINAEGVVTRTQTFGKEKKAAYTETKKVSFSNLDTFISKALEVSSTQVPSADEAYVFSMIHNGQTYRLNMDDSTESLFLVRIISRVCR